MITVNWATFQLHFLNVNRIYIVEDEKAWKLYTTDNSLIVKCIVDKSANQEENMIFIERYFSGRNSMVMAESIDEDSYEDEDIEEKHKYIRRTGRPGNYQYEYPGDKKERGPRKQEDSDTANSSFDDAIQELAIQDVEYDKVWDDYNSEKITEKERGEKLKELNDKYETRRTELTKQMLDSREKPKKELVSDFTEYPDVQRVESGLSDKGHIVEMSPDEYFSFVPEKSQGDYVFHTSALKRVKDYVNKTGKLAVGFIEVDDNKVVEHEGRHTAAVARIFGVKKIKVLISGPDHKSFGKDTEKQYKHREVEE